MIQNLEKHQATLQCLDGLNTSGAQQAKTRIINFPHHLALL